MIDAGQRESPGRGGPRSTRQKRALSAALEASGSFRSAQDLFTELRASGENVGLTTVYAQLRSLAETGAVDALRSDDGETLYRRCDSEAHHHHLVCRGCGRTVEVEGPEVESWAAGIAAQHGFVDVTHTLEIVGACADCGHRPSGAPGCSGAPPRPHTAGAGG